MGEQWPISSVSPSSIFMRNEFSCEQSWARAAIYHITIGWEEQDVMSRVETSELESKPYFLGWCLPDFLSFSRENSCVL
jgi:hypothetical protein